MCFRMNTVLNKTLRFMLILMLINFMKCLESLFCIGSLPDSHHVHISVGVKSTLIPPPTHTHTCAQYVNKSAVHTSTDSFCQHLRTCSAPVENDTVIFSADAERINHNANPHCGILWLCVRIQLFVWLMSRSSE